MNYRLIFTGVLAALCACSCVQKTEAERIAGFKETANRSCISSWKASNEFNAPEPMIISVCGCSIDKLTTTYPIGKLEELDQSQDRSLLQSTMLPIVKECVEKEIAKMKTS